MKSEEIWHKVHVAASYATIPFVLISILLIFINNMWFKIALGLILLLLLPRIWDIVVKIVTKKDALEINQKEQRDLEEQIKKNQVGDNMFFRIYAKKRKLFHKYYLPEKLKV